MARLKNNGDSIYERQFIGQTKEKDITCTYIVRYMSNNCILCKVTSKEHKGTWKKIVAKKDNVSLEAFKNWTFSDFIVIYAQSRY